MRFRALNLVTAAALAVALFGVSVSLAQPNNRIAGIWDTTEGQMKIEQSGGEVSGIYGGDDGRIFSTLQGNSLTGIWVERGSGVTCETPRDGSVHWGEFVFTFADDFRSFTGNWTYCGQSRTHRWNGTLKSAAKLIF